MRAGKIAVAHINGEAIVFDGFIEQTFVIEVESLFKIMLRRTQGAVHHCDSLLLTNAKPVTSQDCGSSRQSPDREGGRGGEYAGSHAPLLKPGLLIAHQVWFN